jgi:hypothetical protein
MNSDQDQKPGCCSHLRYKCGFCREILVPVPATILWYAATLAGCGRFYCPHCFEIQIRPCGWLRWLLLPIRMVASRFLETRSP